jgi:RimJ/RimL family protein N-acetyltransferase
MMADMDDDLTLRLAAAADLPILERLTQDPESAGEFAWLGWYKLTRFRQWWAENRLISDDISVLMVARDGERLGFVTWHKVSSTPGYYYWNIGIALLPEARGKGYGTQAQRMLAQYLFKHTTVQRIEAATEVGNVAERGPWRRRASPGRACTAAPAGGTVPTGTGSGTAWCAPIWPAEPPAPARPARGSAQ